MQAWERVIWIKPNFSYRGKKERQDKGREYVWESKTDTENDETELETERGERRNQRGRNREEKDEAEQEEWVEEEKEEGKEEDGTCVYIFCLTMWVEEKAIYFYSKYYKNLLVIINM